MTIELCVNLWYCVDGESGFVAAIAGRGYFLSGNDEQKTVILKALASADYLNVEWMPIPERYQTTLVDTKSNDTALFTGILHSVDVDLMGLDLFEEVFKQIEAIDQAYLPIKHLQEIKVQDEPLYVLTPVRNTNGIIKAIT